MKISAYITAISLFFALQTFGQTATDTIISVKNPDRVIITQSSNGFGVKIEGSGNDKDFVANYIDDSQSASYSTKFSLSSLRNSQKNKTISKNSPWDASAGAILFGLTSSPGDGILAVEPSKSFEITVLKALSVSYTIPGSRSGFEIGVGFGWRNYRTTKDYRFGIDDAGNISPEAYPSGVTPRFSRLKTFALSFPILFNQSTGIKVARTPVKFSVGTVLNWNSHTSVLTEWREADGTTIKESADNVAARKFSADIIGIIRVAPGFGIYARYNPAPMLKKGCGPQFHQFSAGIAVAL